MVRRFHWSRGGAVTFAVAMACTPLSVSAQNIVAPDVPGNIAVPEGHKLLTAGHAVGTQNYICLPSGAGVAWTLVGPQATLFDADDEQIMTHFLSPNPDEAGIARATWQHSRTTSAVWATAVQPSSDPAYVEPGAIPWLLLQVVGREDGPTGGHRLTQAKYIQRLNTRGGTAPAGGCAASADLGRRVFVPYTADYFFYRRAPGKDATP